MFRRSCGRYCYRKYTSRLHPCMESFSAVHCTHRTSSHNCVRGYCKYVTAYAQTQRRWADEGAAPRHLVERLLIEKHKFARKPVAVQSFLYILIAMQMPCMRTAPRQIVTHLSIKKLFPQPVAKRMDARGQRRRVSRTNSSKSSNLPSSRQKGIVAVYIIGIGRTQKVVFQSRVRIERQEMHSNAYKIISCIRGSARCGTSSINEHFV